MRPTDLVARTATDRLSLQLALERLQLQTRLWVKQNEKYMAHILYIVLRVSNEAISVLHHFCEMEFGYFFLHVY